MKTFSKILLSAAVLFTGNGLFAQGKSGGHINSHAQIRMPSVTTSSSTNGKITRENARINGSLNANANANANGKNHANANSVLKPGTTTRVKGNDDDRDDNTKAAKPTKTKKPKNHHDDDHDKDDK
ncbi:MAG: hypothetical protein M3004_02320 [Bacteroidota bacterium]|nr:hypothetical protein [Bacteroidota bacterium]